jgi:hypothetical protein
MRPDAYTPNADTSLKDEQRRWEPWKAMLAAFVAGVAVASGMIALITWIMVRVIETGRAP